eukprot:4354934-Lingulodinium_polyedra.AAC.1
MVAAAAYPWRLVVDPAQVYLLTMRRAGLEPAGATELRLASGESLDLAALSPGLVKAVMTTEARRAADRLAMAKEAKDDRSWVGP